MPEHISLLHYLLYRFDLLRLNAHAESLQGHELGYRDYEPLAMALVLMLMLVYLASEVRGIIKNTKEAVIPEEELTLRTFFEVFFETFYTIAKDVMGPKNGKRYFPLIGACAIFIFTSNAIGLIPGMMPPTAGEMARVERERGEYLYVRADGDRAGWVRKADFARVWPR